MEIARSDFVIETDYYQYYIDDGGDLPDLARVDASNDGIVGLDHGHARVSSAVRMSQVDVTLTLTDQPIVLPLPPGHIATAFNMDVRTGKLYVRDWEGSHPPRFEHDFGRRTRCAVLIEVELRDEAASEDSRQAGRERGDHEPQPRQPIREGHVITVSLRPLGSDRWRSAEIDSIGRRMVMETGHIDPGHHG